MSIISNFDKIADVINKLKILNVIIEKDLVTYAICENEENEEIQHSLRICAQRDKPEKCLNTIMKIFEATFSALEISHKEIGKTYFDFVCCIYE